MKKFIFSLIFVIFLVLQSCTNNSTDIVRIVKQYISENNLPITIAEEMIIHNDFNIVEKTNFQLFIMGLLNEFSNKISEGNFNDDIIKNYLALQRIFEEFYDHCLNNNYEVAIIFENTKDILIDYLEFHNFNLTYYNSFIIFDNNTNYTKLSNLIETLVKISDVSRNNIINYLSLDQDNNKTFFYKKLVLVDGLIETKDMNYYYLDVVPEVILLNSSNNLIGNILYLFRIRGYSYIRYENLMEEIRERITELETIIYDFNRNNH